MKCTLSERVYQWREGEAWHIGRLVTVLEYDYEAEAIVEFDGRATLSGVVGHHRVLVRHNHTGDLEFVEWGKLQPYPQGEIPEPTNTGKSV